MSTHPEFIIDENGRKKAVVLGMKDYKKLLEEIEDLRDALELEERARTETDFTPYEKIRDKLKKAGKL